MKIPRWRRYRESVIIYSRSGCPMCQDAERVLVRRFGRKNVQIIDITSDSLLENEYVFRVPVIVVGDAVIAEGAVDDCDLSTITDALRERVTARAVGR